MKLKKSRLILPSIILGSLVFSNTRSFGQKTTTIPDLHVTEIIQGSERDVGKWGDGHTYIIELWGTWCAPCIKNIPKLTAIQAKYANKGLRVIGYSWEDPDKVKKFMEKMGEQMKYILVNDRDEIFLKEVAEKREMVESFPYTFVIDGIGKLIWSGNPSNGLETFIDNYYSH